MITKTTVSFKASIEFDSELKGDEAELRTLVEELKAIGLKIEENQLFLVYRSEIGTSVFGPLVKIK